jgi:D-tyrosyl-tRNA(Tyr) deacylase
VRACIQRVSRASVTVDGQIVGRIERGFVVLVAVAATDTPRDAEWVAQKIVDLRIFPDDEGKMNRSLSDIRGAVLVISQFTLMGDCRKGRRPSFVAAADPVLGERLYESVVDHLRRAGVLVATGVFQQHMDVELVNDGPVTILLDSQKTF